MDRVHRLDSPGHCGRVATWFHLTARRIAPFLAGALFLAPLSQAYAQTPHGSQPTGTDEFGAVAGIVTTMDEVPLELAHITVIGPGTRASSQADGRFHVGAVAPGIHVLEVRLLGYSRVTLPIEIEAGETLQLHVVMTIEPVPLAPVAVRRERGPLITPQMREFEARRARGAGKFFTQTDIQRMQARVFTDVLRRAPGLSILPMNSSNSGSFSAQSTRGGGAVRACPVLFYVNGNPLPMAADVAINTFVVPEEVVGVEVYNASQIPPQFNAALYGARCGVVVVWTRTGIDPGVAR